MLNISDNHHLLRVVPEVNAICQPLFNETQITYFNYARAYHNGEIVGLFTHPEWLLHTLNLKIAPSGVEFKGFKQCSIFGTSIAAPSYMEEKKYSRGVYEFNKLLGFDYLLCLNVQRQNYYEAFAFASTYDNSSIVEFYLNNLDYLRNFANYFQDKAGSLIQRASESANRIVYPDLNTLNISKNFSQENSEYIYVNNKPIQLSKRELECLSFIAKGRSAKEMAKILGISNRTVEVHIYNMKAKLNCHTKSELIDIAVKNSLNFCIL